MTPIQKMTSGAGRVLGGRYTLLTPIAQGGMGEVWKARDRVSGHIVAAKVLRPELSGEELSLSRLRLEARNSMSISHPNIANVQDSGEEDGIGWIIMELVEGFPLTDYLRGGARLAPEYLMPVLVQVAMALGAASRAGVVHRDIKPANILVRPDGVVKLTDFGISRATGQVNLTAVGMVMGTAQYLPPEQAMGEVATPIGDLYALGVIAYEAATGKRPFTGETQVDIAFAHVNDPVPPLPDFVPEPLADVILHLLEKDPAKRPESGSAAVRELAGAAKAMGIPVTPTPLPPPRSVSRSNAPRTPVQPSVPIVAPVRHKPRRTLPEELLRPPEDLVARPRPASDPQVRIFDEVDPAPSPSGPPQMLSQQLPAAAPLPMRTPLPPAVAQGAAVAAAPAVSAAVAEAGATTARSAMPTQLRASVGVEAPTDPAVETKPSPRTRAKRASADQPPLTVPDLTGPEAPAPDTATTRRHARVTDTGTDQPPLTVPDLAGPEAPAPDTATTRRHARVTDTGTDQPPLTVPDLAGPRDTTTTSRHAAVTDTGMTRAEAEEALRLEALTRRLRERQKARDREDAAAEARRAREEERRAEEERQRAEAEAAARQERERRERAEAEERRRQEARRERRERRERSEDDGGVITRKSPSVARVLGTVPPPRPAGKKKSGTPTAPVRPRRSVFEQRVEPDPDKPRWHALDARAAHSTQPPKATKYNRSVVSPPVPLGTRILRAVIVALVVLALVVLAAVTIKHMIGSLLSAHAGTTPTEEVRTWQSPWPAV